jgi:hypothetical protein
MYTPQEILVAKEKYWWQENNSPGVPHAHAQDKPIPIFSTPYQGYKRRLLYRVGGWRVGGA